MTKPGISIESAASTTLKDTIKQHFQVFAHVIRGDRVASQSVTAAYISGLAGTVALSIAGGFVSREEAEKLVMEKFRNQLTEDLQHLGRK